MALRRAATVVIVGVLVGCTPTEPPASANAPAALPVAASPTTAPPAAQPFEVSVTNVGGTPCQYALHSGDGWPDAEEPTATLPPRKTTMVVMAPGEKLCVKNLDGRFGTSASVERPDGEILVRARCSGVAAADDGFTAEQRAWLAPHTFDACCKDCEGRACSGCSDPEPGKPCKAAVETAAKCALVADVGHCAPADHVDADGNVALHRG